MVTKAPGEVAKILDMVAKASIMSAYARILSK